MTFQTTITEVCTYIGDNWMIDPYPPQELLEGYFHLISKEYKNQHFSMYGFIMNETLYIKGCVFNGKRLVRTVLIFTESSDQLSRATDRVPGLPASPGYVQ